MTAVSRFSNPLETHCHSQCFCWIGANERFAKSERQLSVKKTIFLFVFLSNFMDLKTRK